jgi:hypothetical protein
MQATKTASIHVAKGRHTHSGGWCDHLTLQVTIWLVNQQWQPVPACSYVEDGGSITHAVWLTGGSSSTAAAAHSLGASIPALCYSVSTPGSATVTVKYLDVAGAASVIQVCSSTEWQPCLLLTHCCCCC